MIKLVLVGSGNVATQLFQAFFDSEEVKVIQVVGRNTTHLEFFEPYTETGALSDLKKGADIYIIAVSDDSLNAVYQQLNTDNKLFAHTSGVASMKVLPDRRKQGVFYPLQTFTRDKKLDLKKVPVCIEAESEEDLKLLRKVAESITDRVVEIGSDKRPYLHLAAVFANNFSNHLFHLSNEIMKETGLPFDLLVPLIQETVAKLELISPYNAQTGPARRQDSGTMKRHQDLLNNTDVKEIYSLLSTSIQNTYAKKL